MKTFTKKFPVIAGKFGEKMKVIGYRIVLFTENQYGQLIHEREIKRVIY